MTSRRSVDVVSHVLSDVFFVDLIFCFAFVAVREVREVERVVLEVEMEPKSIHWCSERTLRVVAMMQGVSNGVVGIQSEVRRVEDMGGDG